MTNWIKIDNCVFNIKEATAQLSMGSHATIELSVDSRKDYSDFFFNKFESGTKFDIIGKNFDAKGALIKRFFLNGNQINISIRCDILQNRDISQRREEIIDDILNNQNTNNIK